MHVAVCIVGFRNSPDLRECLLALSELDHRSFEVVICENGGRDAWTQLQAQLPERLPEGQSVTIVPAERNLGYAGGVNVCIQHSCAADAWWILNPDTRPEPESLSWLVSRLEDGDCDLVGGVLMDERGRARSLGGRWRPWLARPETILPAPRPDARERQRVEAVISYVSGASMLVGRTFLEVAGLMREDYFLYCEEVEWCLRGAQLGMRIGFAPLARVAHKQGTTTGTGLPLWRRPKLPVFLDERNKVLVTRDQYPLRLPIAAAALLAQIVIRFGRNRAWSQLGHALHGWSAGLLNRRGPPPWFEV
jgi:N-acetylglucosaminyl-diphospho-decaprenol L-rhamnosyltransferase